MLCNNSWLGLSSSITSLKGTQYNNFMFFILWEFEPLVTRLMRRAKLLFLSRIDSFPSHAYSSELIISIFYGGKFITTAQLVCTANLHFSCPFKNYIMLILSEIFLEFKLQDFSGKHFFWTFPNSKRKVSGKYSYLFSYWELNKKLLV